ncbi:hypothetical protein LWI28_006745 [Acer negundo]|uniref:Uncharacterized protein n=1 Tax=Acer negundo TaxID=4023 RepID=A0AAD5IFY9_ACENE|nr:hypothetical protein LWI28_006745 [Acer negundo]
MTMLTPPCPLKLIEVKKEKGLKHWSVPVGIPKLPTPSARPTKPSVLELKARPLKFLLLKKKKPLALSEKEVVEAFRRFYPSGRLASLSLTPALEVTAKGSFSIIEGFKCFLAIEQLVVSFQEELLVYERMRVNVEA